MGRPLLRDEVPVGKCNVRALFSWSGESPQDLGFVEGDIIEVLNNGDGDWWTGKLKRNKLVGVFPRNFAEYVDENQKTISAARSAAPTRKKHEIGEFALDTLDIDDPISSLQITQAPEKQHSKSHTKPTTVADLKSVPQQSVNLKLSQQSGKLAPLTTSLNSSVASTKSTLEILDDVGAELNGGFLDDIDLDVKPEELASFQPDPKPKSDAIVHSHTSKSELSKPQSSSSKNSQAPIPPPHSVLGSSRNSRSMVPPTPPLTHATPVSNAPPKTYSAPIAKGTKIPSASSSPKIPTSPKQTVSSAKTGPVITKTHHPESSLAPPPSDLHESKYSPSPQSGLGIDLRDPSSLTPRPHSFASSPLLDDEVPFDAKVLQKEESVVVPKRRDDKKPNFLQRLFPKNSQLRRTFSRSSQKSNKSSKSVKSRLRNVKSLFGFSPGFNPDDNLYPSNYVGVSSGSASKPVIDLSGSKNDGSNTNFGVIKDNTTGVSGAALKPISTPPRTKVSSTYDTTAKMKASASSSKHSSSVQQNTLLGAVSAGPLNSKEAVGGKWIETRRDLYRAQTLTDRDLRRRRQELELQGVNCDNLVENLNPLADSGAFHDYRLESFMEVDQAVLHMSTWPQLMTPSVFASSRIGRHFEDPVERVRAVFLLCAMRITHVNTTPQPNNVMHSRMATPLELATTVCDMCNAVDIECRVVQGHIRSIAPNGSSIESVPHAWNAVKLNSEWRLIDCVTAAASSSSISDGSIPPGDDDDDDAFVNLFYFLAPPAQLIFSHVPNSQQDQFSEHPLPTASAALLPLASPAAFAHNVMFDDFWLGLTRVADLEVVELTLNVPDNTKDIVAFVDNQPQFALSQAIWDLDEGTRHFRVKAFIPQHKKQSLLQLYVVPKAQAERNANTMELVWTCELRHVSGGKNNTPFEFIGRYAMPTESTFKYDFYVKEPQCRSLSGGDLYNFKIDCFDAHAGSKVAQPNMAIQSPSGRLTRLVPVGTNVTDTFKTAVKTLEVGTWRAVARSGESDGWMPFAEWFCS